MTRFGANKPISSQGPGQVSSVFLWKFCRIKGEVCRNSILGLAQVRHASAYLSGLSRRCKTLIRQYYSVSNGVSVSPTFILARSTVFRPQIIVILRRTTGSLVHKIHRVQCSTSRDGLESGNHHDTLRCSSCGATHIITIWANSDKHPKAPLDRRICKPSRAKAWRFEP